MKAFQYEKVKDPAWFQENRAAAHSDHRYYGSMEEMEQKQENFRYSLNGLWKFHYANNYHSTIPGFESMDYCCRSWDDIHAVSYTHLHVYKRQQQRGAGENFKPEYALLRYTTILIRESF